MRKSFIYLMLFLAVTIFCLNAQQNIPSLKIESLTENIYKLTYTANLVGNLVLSVGEDGILLVDTGTPAVGEPLLKELKKFQGKDVKVIINTHFHQDHTGGNIAFASSAKIIGHQNIRPLLTTGDNILNEFPEAALPVQEIEKETAIKFNGEAIKLIPMLGGHSKSDIVVYFTKSGIVHVGDMIFSDRFPFVDLNAGGNVAQYLTYLQQFTTMFPAGTRFIVGHGRDYQIDDIKNYYSELSKTVQVVKTQMEAGKSLQQMIGDDILKDWNSWAGGFISTAAWITAIYNSEKSLPSAKPSINEALYKTVKNEPIEKAIQLYHTLKTEKSNDYDFSEPKLNFLGYYLLNHNRIKDAIAIFKLNVEAFPDAWNVYDSLGEAYALNGDTELAIQNYRKSLEINPQNTNAVQALKKLEGK
ncbi:MBL fold metallo-hydrolase [candidate division KSB1 bacterium]|nr:MBL fold metallo-hydrolase [candidate division KSB1 bacterium]